MRCCFEIPSLFKHRRTEQWHYTRLGVSMSTTHDWSRPGWLYLFGTHRWQRPQAVPFPTALMESQLIPYPLRGPSTNMVLLLELFWALCVIHYRDTQSMEASFCTRQVLLSGNMLEDLLLFPISTIQCYWIVAIQRKDVGRFAFIPPIPTCSLQTGCIPLTFSP